MSTGFFSTVEYVTDDKPFQYGTDPDYDPDPGIIDGIFTTAGTAICKNFVGSAASAEVCAVRALWFNTPTSRPGCCVATWINRSA